MIIGGNIKTAKAAANRIERQEIKARKAPRRKARQRQGSTERYAPLQLSSWTSSAPPPRLLFQLLLGLLELTHPNGTQVS